MKKLIALAIAFTMFFLAYSKEQKYVSLQSPNSKVEIQLQINRNQPYYRILYNSKKLLDWSGLGFQFKQIPSLKENFKITNTKITSVDTVWETVWGEKDKVRNNYNQLSVRLKESRGQKRNIELIFRASNDGIGFRYILPPQTNLNKIEITSEETEFKFTKNNLCWWIPADYDSYEYLYRKSFLDEIDSVNTPITMQTEDGLYLSIHEAALSDYAGMTLKNINHDQTLTCNLVPWPDGIKVKGKVPLKTPWRTIEIGESPGDLLESDLILNLNKPNQIENTAWITPMKYIGIWWGQHIDKYTWGSGPIHGATTENTKRYIDFASRAFNSDSQRVGLLVEGWNLGWDGDWTQNGDKFSFTESYPDFNVEEVINYCHKNNVEYIMHNENGGSISNYESQIDTAFHYYQKLGVHAIKTGNVAPAGIKNPKGQHHHGQYMVNHYRKVVKLAAKHRIMLDVHEPIKPTGIRRTWPNMMTREGGRGMEYNAWSAGNPPDHTTILPFTRLLGGPMDYTPGIFDLTFNEYKPENRVFTTLAKQLAYYVVLYSPLQMAADLPENYNHSAFQFIKDVPVDWDITHVIDAAIGDFVMIARKAEDEWYLGGITDENPRKLEIPLEFLTENIYLAEIYSDASESGLFENPNAIEIKKYIVEKDDTISAALATSGGIAIRFIPASKINDINPYQSIKVFNNKSNTKINSFKKLKIYNK